MSRGQFPILEDLKNEFHQIDSATNINKFQKEYDLIDTMSVRLNAEYDNVFKASEKEFTMIPSTFQYGKDMTASIKGLQDRIHAETQNQSTSSYTPNEIKKMEGVLHSLKGEVGESVVRSEFERLWHGKQGVLFHSFAPEILLSPLTSRAKLQRLSKSDLNFTDLELKLAKILGIDLKKIENEAAMILNSIKANVPSFVGSFTIQALDTGIGKLPNINNKHRNLIQDFIKQTSKKMKRTCFKFDEAEKIISIASLHHIMKPDGEMDFLGLLVSEKLVFNFEVKYQIADNKHPPTKLLNYATRQLKTNEDYISRVFAPLFSNGWRLIKVPIIIQQNTSGTLDPSSYCKHCAKYIITSGSLYDLPQWFKESQIENKQPSPISTLVASLMTGTKKSHKNKLPQNLELEEVEFLRFFELITSSISTSSRLSAWNWVQGNNYKLPVGAGYTRIQPPTKIGKGKFANPKGKALLTGSLATASASNSDVISLEEALYKYHDAQKLLFYSRLQVSLLNCSFYLHTILMGDYGVGTTVSENRIVVF